MTNVSKYADLRKSLQELSMCQVEFLGIGDYRIMIVIPTKLPVIRVERTIPCQRR